MPLFRRPDGTLIKDESPIRRMIPYVMLGRNEAAVYHDEYYDLTRTKPWLKEWNRSHEQAATLFHLFIWAAGKALLQRQGLNRFVSGGRLYQRKGSFISFSAKKSFRDDSPLLTIKHEVIQDESFDDCVKRIVKSINEPRKQGVLRAVDKEVALAMKLPGPVLRAALWLWRALDRINLLPGKLIENDPLYSSIFVANLGSVGLDNTYHHLYEYGNIGLFAVLGTPKKTIVVGPDDKPMVKEMLQVRWTLDERINDGFYCASSLRQCQRIFENPEKYMPAPEPKASEPKAPEPEAAEPTSPDKPSPSNGQSEEAPRA